MCGLTGAFARGAAPGDPAGLVRQMTPALRHRGPDDEGYWEDRSAGVALGFRRLAIQDLSAAGHQPMSSASGRYTLVFNGEVYNFKELGECLRDEGHRFRGHSDTEVILAAFEKWGIAASVPRFNGMFAMGVWDAERRSLTLIRDRLGIKPLYVYRAPGLVLFASELKAIFAAEGARRDLDREGLADFLRYLYIPAPRTILKHARKLLPGHYLEIVDPCAELPDAIPFWSLDEAASAGIDPEALREPDAFVERTERLIEDAVKLRTRADVPVGAFLSGGIDSSLVVALMQRITPHPVRTFTVAFDASEHNEAHHARAVAEHLGTEHTEVAMGAEAVLELVPRIPDIFDEPLANPAQLPTYLISQVAREAVTVALLGDGGDELFGGYNRYVSGGPLIGRLDRVPHLLRRVGGRGVLAISQGSWDRVVDAGARVVPSLSRVRLAGEKMHKVGRLLAAGSSSEMYDTLMSAWPESTPPVTASAPKRGRVAVELERRPQHELTACMMLVDQRGYLPDDLLAKVDRASMAVALEARVPLLDHRVVEHSWRTPMDMKIRDGKGKWILRRILERHVPGALFERPKMGFTVPIARWLRGELREWSEDLLDPASLARDGLLRPEPIRRAWQELQRGKDGSALGLWATVVFQAWRRRWMA